MNIALGWLAAILVLPPLLAHMRKRLSTQPFVGCSSQAETAVSRPGARYRSYSLRIAPNDSPRTRYRCSAKAIITTGSAPTAAMAAMSPHST